MSATTTGSKKRHVNNETGTEIRGGVKVDLPQQQNHQSNERLTKKLKRADGNTQPPTTEQQIRSAFDTMNTILNTKDSNNEITNENIKKWSAVAGQIWRDCVCVRRSPVDESDHKCEEIQENFSKMDATSVQQCYDHKCNQLSQFLFSMHSDLQMFGSELRFGSHQNMMTCSFILNPVFLEDVGFHHQFLENVSAEFGTIQYDVDKESQTMCLFVPYLPVCTIENIHFMVYLVTSTTATTTPTIPHQEYHICLPNVVCELADSHSQFKLIYEDKTLLWGCKETGILHLCGSFFCTLKIPLRDSMLCRRTGLNMNFISEDNIIISTKYARKAQIHWSPWKSANLSKHDDSVTNHSIESLLRNYGGFTNLSNLFDSGVSELNDIHNKKTEIKDRRLLYLFAAMKKIEILFSDERIEQEALQKMKSQENEIEREVNRMDIRASKSNKPLDLLAVCTVVQNIRNKKGLVIQGSIPKRVQRTLSLNCAYKVIILYWIILTKTEYGRNNPEKFPFHPFVLAALQVFASGFLLPDMRSSVSRMIQLILPDPVLQTFHISNAIDAYNSKFSTSTTNQRSKTSMATSSATQQFSPYMISPSLITMNNTERYTNTTTTTTSSTTSVSNLPILSPTQTSSRFTSALQSVLKKKSRNQGKKMKRATTGTASSKSNNLIKRLNLSSSTTIPSIEGAISTSSTVLFQQQQQPSTKKKITNQIVNMVRKAIESALTLAINQDECAPSTLQLSTYSWDHVEAHIFKQPSFFKTSNSSPSKQKDSKRKSKQTTSGASQQRDDNEDNDNFQTLDNDSFEENLYSFTDSNYASGDF